ncbi:hypothetical protein SLEP1_g35694 [Rubroshorea leprosula]|uniref:Disease resistance protein At4g27190-like leucine-rich repeats domain-containing protein n=1 Tax=Rubroshorea leprosula TaxID=152421 RepID=A0AAV5KP70_9ROSI|nr:hypothetical protein SLEP1_g35694 [Rubroshorea leprosula]
MSETATPPSSKTPSHEVVPGLERLSLTSNDIEMICNLQLPEHIFSNVKSLEVHCIHGDLVALPIFFLERFCNLQKLQIYCSDIMELFPPVASIDCSEKDVGRHLRITKLRLNRLSKLNYIWKQGPASDLLVQNVKSLEVLVCDSLISLSESTVSFRNLTTLLVGRCEGLRNLFSFATAQSLVQLRSISVEYCHFLTEIVGGEGVGLEDVIVFSKLKVLKLKCLTRLASFCSTNFTFNLPLLEELMVVQCPKFETFCHGVLRTPSLQRIQFAEQDNIGRPVAELNSTINQLYKEKVGYVGLQELKLSDFPQLMEVWNKNPQQILDFTCLHVLKICNCGSLRYVLTPSMALSLVVLQTLEVQNCEMIEKIITEEGGMEVPENKMIFPLLRNINLESCFNLTSFCSGSYGLEFPFLSVMHIIDCPKMVTFASTFSTVQVKEAVDGGSKERTGKQVTDIPTEPFFSDQVAFPLLEKLRIIELDNLRILWHHQPPEDSFCKLKCSLEEIFELGEVNIEESHGVLDTLLRELTIKNLPRLKHVWTKDPRGILSFRNLQSVTASGCPNLQNMFPASVAMEFQQLEKLRLFNCGIEEVVAFGGEEAFPRFVFSRLSTLCLWHLPRLKCFYPREHVTEWPKLKYFKGYHLEGIKETNVESLGTFPVQLPLFTVEKDIPRLEKLSLTSDDIAMICTRQFPEDLFSNVKVLRVLCYHSELTVFPLFFIERFFNLEELFIGCSGFKELFPSVASIDCQEEDAKWHLRIRKLKLDALFNLKYIWSQGSASDLLVQSVESLKVRGCANLISLSESTPSFRNLTTLFVERCQGLRNLFSFATAQSLVQLQSITVQNCHFLTEIVGGEGDGLDLEEVIVFSKLKVLKLECLTRLASFCSANFTFKFPLLEKVMVAQCVNFVTFCHGVVRTPRLQRIQLTQEDNAGRPVVELNDTINQLYKEKVGFSGLQYLKLSDFPQLVEIWNKDPQEILDFKQLCVLEICNCSDLKYLLTPSMTLSLVSLIGMKVKNCEMMEQIVTEEEATGEDEKEMIFPLIKTINLESCPNLTSFCVGNYKLECPSLTWMKLLDCPKMVTFASTFSTVQVKEAAEGGAAERIGKEVIDIPTAPFFSDEVEFSSFLELTLSSMNMRQIFQEQLLTMSLVVHSVEHLILKECGNLKYLFTSSMIKSLVQLKSLEIRDCVMMKEVIVNEGLTKEESLLLAKLETLTLEGLPKLTRFCSGNYFEFGFLTFLHIIKCPLLETFISNSNVGEMSHMTESKIVEGASTLSLFDVKVGFPRLKHLVLKDMESLNLIWDNQLNAESFHKLDQLLVESCEKLSNIFSIIMLGRLQNLDKLKIENCVSLETIFEPPGLNASETQALKIGQSNSFGATPNFVFPKVTHLLLKGLPSLKSICPGIYFTVWSSLKELVIFGCNQVQILASELLSYQRTCRENQLENHNQCPLFLVSKATFPSLEELIVERNESMKEIWHGDDVKDGIVFTKLESLQLKVLPKLESFCSGNCNFEFPSLADVTVMECPNMLTFSEGEVSTPKLQKVKLTENSTDEGIWQEGGINPTIQQLFTKKPNFFTFSVLPSPFCGAAFWFTAPIWYATEPKIAVNFSNSA